MKQQVTFAQFLFHFMFAGTRVTQITAAMSAANTSAVNQVEATDAQHQNTLALKEANILQKEANNLQAKTAAALEGLLHAYREVNNLNKT